MELFMWEAEVLLNQNTNIEYVLLVNVITQKMISLSFFGSFFGVENPIFKAKILKKVQLREKLAISSSLQEDFQRKL
jgi:hypothetical protein